MKVFSLRSVVALTFLVVLSSAQGQKKKTYCRPGGIFGGNTYGPHQAGLFQADFPIDSSDLPSSICEGSVSIENNEICVTGQMTYEQVAEKVGRPIFSPAATSITVPGHLVSGSGNAVLGTEAYYIYDFITSVTIEGTQITSQAGSTLTETLLAAASGLIEKVCFDESIFSKEKSWYRISHNFYLTGFENLEKLLNANIIYISTFTMVGEYHRTAPETFFTAHIINRSSSFFSGVTPDFVFRLVPLLGLTGVFRSIVNGVMATEEWPQPLLAPNSQVEDVQIDCAWSTLKSAMEDGLFKEGSSVPIYFGVLIKKIEQLGNGFSCWGEAGAAIDIQAPPTWGDDLDDYIKDHVYPKLKKYGDVGLHFGKRLPPNSDILQSALDFYSSCGVTVPAVVATCYHPVCTREVDIQTFEYPEAIYEEQ